MTSQEGPYQITKNQPKSEADIDDAPHRPSFIVVVGDYGGTFLSLSRFRVVCSLLFTLHMRHLSRLLQGIFQDYQSGPFDSNESNYCGVEMPLMDHVFGARYGALFVGKKETSSIH